MRALLYTFIFLITYGSLYPFAFESTTLEEALRSPLLDFRMGNSRRGDLVSNLLLFVPFGFLAFHCYSGSKPVPRVVNILIGAFVLAYLIQVAQLIVPGRTPSGSDALWNVLGCAAGCALANLPTAKYRHHFTGPEELPPVALVLGLLWLLYNWAPFVPSLDLQLLKNHIKVIISSDMDTLWLLRKVVMWLVIFHFLRTGPSRLVRDTLFPVIVLVTLFGGLFIVGHRTSIEHIAGGLISIPLWFLIHHRARSLWLTLFLGFAVLATTFTPFEARNQISSFQWVPFSGALEGNLMLNVMSIFNKLIVYGALICLLIETGLQLRTATALVAVVLFASELLQVFFNGPTPEITDPLLALAIGITFRWYERIRAAGSQRADTEQLAHGTNGARRAPIGAAPVDAPGREDLILNLHQYQALFLQQAADTLGWTLDMICTEVIKLAAADPSASATSNSLDRIQPNRTVLVRDPGWTALAIKLDKEIHDSLIELAKNSPNNSQSSTLRHLIDDHINWQVKNREPQ